jgi:archaellum component FlaC
MSDLQKILSVLGTIQNDISDLKIGQELIKVEQEGIKEELRTMKAAAVHNVDSLSKQFNGVVRDFGSFGDKMLQSFEKWSEQADSRVVENVMAIQGPRIRAMEDRLHEIIKAG